MGLCLLQQSKCIYSTANHLIITGGICTPGMYLEHSWEIWKKRVSFPPSLQSEKCRQPSKIITAVLVTITQIAKKVENNTHLIRINNVQNRCNWFTLRCQDLVIRYFFLPAFNKYWLAGGWMGGILLSHAKMLRGLTSVHFRAACFSQGLQPTLCQ